MNFYVLSNVIHLWLVFQLHILLTYERVREYRVHKAQSYGLVELTSMCVNQCYSIRLPYQGEVFVGIIIGECRLISIHQD